MLDASMLMAAWRTAGAEGAPLEAVTLEAAWLTALTAPPKYCTHGAVTTFWSAFRHRRWSRAAAFKVGLRVTPQLLTRAMSLASEDSMVVEVSERQNSKVRV
jgi:hypothetical protein